MSPPGRARIFLGRPLAAGAVLELPPAPSRHVQVLRLQPGDAVALFDGENDLEWPAEITRIERKAVTVRLGTPRRVARELPLRVALAIGMPANERMDGVIEKATELGVAAVQPLVCERSVVRLSGERGQARRRHWSAVAAAASEQSGRVRVPAIAAPQKLDAWLGALVAAADKPQADAAQRWLLSLNGQAVAPASLLPSPRPDNAAAEIVVLSGPEGGLSAAEESLAQRCGFTAVSLGSRVLRADTAPLALLAWLGIALRSDPP